MKTHWNYWHNILRFCVYSEKNTKTCLITELCFFSQLTGCAQQQISRQPMRPLVATVTWISLKLFWTCFWSSRSLTLCVLEGLWRFTARSCGSPAPTAVLLTSTDKAEQQEAVQQTEPLGLWFLVETQDTNCIPYAVTSVRLLIISAPKIRLLLQERLEMSLKRSRRAGPFGSFSFLYVVFQTDDERKAKHNCRKTTYKRLRLGK